MLGRIIVFLFRDNTRLWATFVFTALLFATVAVIIMAMYGVYLLLRSFYVGVVFDILLIFAFLCLWAIFYFDKDMLKKYPRPPK